MTPDDGETEPRDRSVAGDDGFVIDLRDAGGLVVVDVTGEVDEATRRRLAERLDAAVDGAFAERSEVHVDMTGVSFMDSWGLGALLAAHARAEELGVGFEVTGASRQVAHLFVVTGVAVDYGWPTFADE